MADHKTPSLFAIDFTTPPKEGRTWWDNRTVSVLSMTIQRAITVVTDRYPEAVIHAVNRRSRGEVLTDEQLEEK